MKKKKNKLSVSIHYDIYCPDNQAHIIIPYCIARDRNVKLLHRFLRKMIRDIKE